jgi:hypothetical protein
MQTKFVEANGLRFEVLEGVGAMPARLPGARHLLATPDTGAGRNRLSGLGGQSARIWAHHPATEVADYALPHLVDDVTALINAASAKKLKANRKV